MQSCTYLGSLRTQSQGVSELPRCWYRLAGSRSALLRPVDAACRPDQRCMRYVRFLGPIERLRGYRLAHRCTNRPVQPNICGASAMQCNTCRLLGITLWSPMLLAQRKQQPLPRSTVWRIFNFQTDVALHIGVVTLRMDLESFSPVWGLDHAVGDLLLTPRQPGSQTSIPCPLHWIHTSEVEKNPLTSTREVTIWF